jgi:hypothetical protein
VTTPLTPQLIEPLMQIVTMISLGLDPTDSASAKAVRVGWQQTGQPASSITEDVVYIRCIEEDDLYNRIRDIELSDVLPEPSAQITQTTSYTRVWRTFWVLYGPSSFDNARKIKSALFAQSIHDILLEAFNTYGQLPSGVTGYGGNEVPLYLVTDVTAPVRVPENFGAQWWERVDFSCQFNEGVTEQEVLNAVASAEVIIENSDGILADEVLYQGDPPDL